MRLIDANAFMKEILLMKRLNAKYSLGTDDKKVNNYDTGQQETFDLIIKHLDEFSIAYDIDKVIEQLEELKSQVPEELSQLMAYDEAIKIVKAGGNVNE